MASHLRSHAASLFPLSVPSFSYLLVHFHFHLPFPLSWMFPFDSLPTIPIMLVSLFGVFVVFVDPFAFPLSRLFYSPTHLHPVQLHPPLPAPTHLRQVLHRGRAVGITRPVPAHAIQGAWRDEGRGWERCEQERRGWKNEWAGQELLKPGALYAECAVVDAPVPTEEWDEKHANSRENENNSALVDDDSELGGERAGRAVWEAYERPLKQWEGGYVAPVNVSEGTEATGVAGSEGVGA
ncbi:hypothetical protein C8J57DRAFT_1673264 [Mycena rebaudengoi]|nr:hypothetical protein C8J57DRAFT_1673264 [Mycena rebaudengoi]